MPKPPPFTGADFDRLKLYLDRAFADIYTQLEHATFVRLPVLHTEPTKLIEGHIVFADGTDWNPGAGKGVYVYYDAAWNKLG